MQLPVTLVDGKTINKNTNVTFLINSPKVVPAIADASAKVVFTILVGGKTTDFGTVLLGDFDFDGQTQLKADFVQLGQDVAVGTWTAQAEYTSIPVQRLCKEVQHCFLHCSEHVSDPDCSKGLRRSQQPAHRNDPGQLPDDVFHLP